MLPTEHVHLTPCLCDSHKCIRMHKPIRMSWDVLVYAGYAGKMQVSPTELTVEVLSTEKESWGRLSSSYDTSMMCLANLPSPACSSIRQPVVRLVDTSHSPHTASAALALRWGSSGPTSWWRALQDEERTRPLRDWLHLKCLRMRCSIVKMVNFQNQNDLLHYFITTVRIKTIHENIPWMTILADEKCFASIWLVNSVCLKQVFMQQQVKGIMEYNKSL